MFDWIRRRRKSSSHEPQERLNLRTGDRASFGATNVSDKLARVLLETARDKAAGLEAGERVTVGVTERHQDVHHMELMVSLMFLAPQYGLQVDTQLDNELTFMKL